MQRLFLILFYLNCFLHQKTIEVLTDETVVDFINSNKIVFLKIYTDWCSHSQSLKQPFIELSRMFSPQIKFAEIDGEKNPEIQKKLKSTGFPNLFVFIDGFNDYKQYFGPLELPILKSYLLNLDEKTIHVYREQYVEDHKNDSHMGYGLFCGEENTIEYQNLLKSLKLLDDVTVYILDNEKKCEEFNMENNTLLYIRKSGDKVSYNEMRDFQKMKRFLKYVKYEVINEFNMNLIGESIGYKIPLIVYFDIRPNPELIDVLKQIYPKVNQNFIIMHNQFKTDFEKEYSELLGVKKDDSPVLMIVFIQKKITKFKHTGVFTLKSVSQFIYDFLHNKLEQHLISEDDPVDSASNFLKVVTANKMRDLLLNKNLDKIILFYTSSCQGCEQSVNLLEEIAKEMVNTKIYFGKVNVANNEVPDMTTIPSLAFFDKDDLNNMDFFKGALDKNLLKNWIMKKHERRMTEEL